MAMAQFLGFYAGLLFSGAAAQFTMNPSAAPGIGVQLFMWPFRDIARECVDFLAPNGYTYVQTSPVAAHAKNAFDGEVYPWYLMYQPLAYTIGNRLGTEADFAYMVQTCKGVGVDVVVDVVLNHNAYVDKSDDGGFGTNQPWSTKRFAENMPGCGYNATHYHDSVCDDDVGTTAHPYTMYNQQFCRSGQLVDIATEQPYVRSKIAGYLNSLIDYGAIGFRFDLGTYVPSNDWRAIFSQLHNTYRGQPPYIAFEAYQLPVTGGGYGDYGTVGRIINDDYTNVVGKMFRNLDGFTTDQVVSILSNPSLITVASSVSTTYIENHDTERHDDSSGKVLSRLYQAANYKQAIAFNILYPFGYAQVHSGYSFKYNGENVREVPVSPPYNQTGYIATVGTIQNNVCSNGWVCQHRWSDVFPLVQIRKFVGDTKISDIFTNGKGSNQIYWNYAGKAFVAINSAQGSQTSQNMANTVSTTLSPGTYCNMVYGYATATDCVLWPGVVLSNGEQVKYVVDASGKTTLSSKSSDKSRVVALYAGSNGFIGAPTGCDVTVTRTSTMTVLVTPPPVPGTVVVTNSVPSDGSPLRVASYAFTDSSLSVVVYIKNIAFDKLVNLYFCDRRGVCGNVFGCSYTATVASGYETWQCSSTTLANGVSSFFISYRVSGTTYFDKGPGGNGYVIAGSTSTTAASSTSAVSSTTTSSVPSSSPTAGASDAFLYFSAKIDTLPGQTLRVVGSVPQLGSNNPGQGLALTANCTSTPCTWTGSTTLPGGKLTQLTWNLVANGPLGVKTTTQCGSSLGLTALPSTFVFINQGAANDNVYQGVRYINLDGVAMC
ncbi:hypothetical protein HDU91_005161 [Kappamyces sp. JEL0680]|nr:hypothetical protein HDU91_005161 [Kappamyces sp. JEL0680]